MRRSSTFIILATLACSLTAFAGIQPGGNSKVIVFKSLTEAQVGPVLSASERFVWDRDTGVAIAEVPGPNLATIPLDAVQTQACEGSDPFQSALKTELPNYGQEGAGAHRFLTKEPVTLTRPSMAPRRPERTASTRSPQDACLYEGFETTPIWYENGGNWWHYQGGQPYNNVGDYFWMDTNCDAFHGTWDVEAIMGGTKGINLPCNSWYDYNTDSWLEFAPWLTCLAGAPGAYLNFYAKVYSQTGLDYFYYTVSVDGTNYTGYRISGSLFDTWYLYSQNMRTWTGLGDLTTYPQFALAFVFQSGPNIPQSFVGYGVHMDDITVGVTSLSVTQVTKMGNPFRLSITGGGFLPGAYVYIDGVQVPTTVFKSPSQLVAKGGSALKAMVPAGVPVCVTVLNPNGGTTACYTFMR